MTPKVTIDSLLPTAADLREAARQSTLGDPASYSMGQHRGRNPDRKDTAGLSKRAIHDAALSQTSPLFHDLAARLDSDPWAFPPSLRTLVPKAAEHPEKGTRPIDDPSEFKRLVVLHVRQLLERRIEAALTTGQYGGRPRWAVEPACPRSGATHQDHVATAIWKGLWDGYRYTLLLDLTNAFGLVPKQAVLNALQELGLDHQAARWIWRLVKIDAVYARSRKLVPINPHLGIEQGNPLSASIMNLVLTPIFRTLETRMAVQVISYLDDIYILTRTGDEARQAFYRFRQSATERGFTNVRRLWKPGDPEDSKLSRIIDANVTTVPVLKTYMVSDQGIALAPEKVHELRSRRILVRKTGITELRKRSSCQALTKQAVRTHNPNILRRPPRMTKDDEDTRMLPPNAVAGGGSERCPGTWATPIRRDPTEGMRPTYIGGKPQGEDRPCGYRPPGGTIPGALTSHNQQQTVLEGDYLPYQGMEDPQVVAFPQKPQRGRVNSKAHGICLGGESHGTEGVDTRGRRRSGATDPSACLSVLEPEVVETCLARRRFKMGTRFKGALLDLQGVEHMVKNDHQLRMVVNGLIRTVREYRKATIRVEVLSSLLAATEILGGAKDLVYRRTNTRSLSDGTVELTLVLRRSRYPKQRKSQAPEAELIVHGVGHHDRSQGMTTLVYEVGGSRVRKMVLVPGPCTPAAALSAVLWALRVTSPSSVAIRLSGPLKALQGLATDMAPRQVLLHDAVVVLTKQWLWERRGIWLVGCRNPQPVFLGVTSQAKGPGWCDLLADHTADDCQAFPVDSTTISETQKRCCSSLVPWAGGTEAPVPGRSGHAEAPHKQTSHQGFKFRQTDYQWSESTGPH